MKKHFLISLFSLIIYSLSYSQCKFPSFLRYLEYNKMKISVLNDGSFFSDKNYKPGLEYPKLTSSQQTNGSRSTYALYGGGLMVSGYDQGKLVMAGSRFPNDTFFDFNPGPIDFSSQKIIPNSCVVFDRIWTIDRLELNNHISKVSKTTTFPIDSSKIDLTILNWPAKGNSRLGGGVRLLDDLAPFVDYNQNNKYDPENGDYPIMYGDITHFWVINDIDNKHTNTKGNPIGIEAQMMAYQFIDSPLDKTTFYKCKIIKKTTGDISNAIVSLFVDPDLGNYTDDYIGCNINGNYGFVYNSTSFDSTTFNSMYQGYGKNIPVITTTFLTQKMGSFIHFENITGIENGYPVTDIENRYIMDGKTKSGTNFKYGGDGLTGNISTKFLFSGNPSNIKEWSMFNSNLPARDVRYLQSSESMDLKYNIPINFDFMVNIHDFKNYTPLIVNIDSISRTIDTLIKFHTNKTSLCVNVLNLKTIYATSGLASVSIDSVVNGTAPYTYKWSSGETTKSIGSKPSGIYTITVTDAHKCSTIKSIELGASNISILTNSEQKISIYPNPTKDEISLFNADFKSFDIIEIQDISGKKVMEFTNKNTSEINIKDLSNGIYFLLLQNNSVSKVLKFVKE